MRTSYYFSILFFNLKVPVLGKMPIDMDYATKADGGFFAAIDNQYITDALAVMPK